MTRAALLLIVSIALCSACAVGAKNLSPSPVVIVPVVQCPAPSAPVMPEINATLPLDSPANVEALMIRDDMFRAYIHGLRSALECYSAQLGIK